MSICKDGGIGRPVPSSVNGILQEETELARLEAELRRRKELLKTAKRELDTSTPTHHLAIAMHHRLCRWNHTDGCGWHYEIRDGIHDWSGHDHARWLRNANMVMRLIEGQPVTADNIVEFFNKLVD